MSLFFTEALMSFRFRLFLFHSSKGFLKKTNSDIRLLDLDIIREKTEALVRKKKLLILLWPFLSCLGLGLSVLSCYKSFARLLSKSLNSGGLSFWGDISELSPEEGCCG